MVPAPTLTIDRGELDRAVKLKNDGWLIVGCFDDMGTKAWAQRLWELVTTMFPSSAMVAYGSFAPPFAVVSAFRHENNSCMIMISHSNRAILKHYR